MSLYGSLVKIGRALMPARSMDTRPIPEPSAEYQRHERILIEDTEPLEQEIIQGARFPSKTAERRIVEIACGLRRGIIKGHKASIVFHFRDGSHIEVTITKPYLLRRYKGGCIVQVDAPI